MKRIKKNYGQEGLGCDKDQDKGKGKMGKGNQAVASCNSELCRRRQLSPGKQTYRFVAQISQSFGLTKKHTSTRTN